MLRARLFITCTRWLERFVPQRPEEVNEYQGRIRGGGGAKGAVAPPPQPRNIGFLIQKWTLPPPPPPPPPPANVAPQGRVYHEIDYKNTPKMSKTGLSTAICTRSRPFCGRGLKIFARDYYFSSPPSECLYPPLNIS